MEMREQIAIATELHINVMCQVPAPGLYTRPTVGVRIIVRDQAFCPCLRSLPTCKLI